MQVLKSRRFPRKLAELELRGGEHQGVRSPGGLQGAEEEGKEAEHRTHPENRLNTDSLSTALGITQVETATLLVKVPSQPWRGVKA